MAIPERKNNVTMTLPSDAYQSCTKDIASLATELTMSVVDENPPVLKFDFKSDLGNGSWQINFANGIELHEFNNDVSQVFAVHYLQDISKAVMNAGRADISMKEGEPIEIVCALPKLVANPFMPEDDDPYPFGYVKFFLASKVEDN
jgi:hypothetical protein